MSGERNIEALQAATAGLTREEDGLVGAYMLGAVANYIDPDVWARALVWALDLALGTGPLVAVEADELLAAGAPVDDHTP